MNEKQRKRSAAIARLNDIKGDDTESTQLVREIVGSCKVGMSPWEKTQHLIRVRKYFLSVIAKRHDDPADYFLWIWADDLGYEWYLNIAKWDRAENPFKGAGIQEDKEKIPFEEASKYQGVLGGSKQGNIDFVLASLRAVEVDTEAAWLSAESAWRAIYPLNAKKTLPPRERGENQKTEVSDVLYNQCTDELVKWATKHRTAIRDQARARGFGNSGCLEGALQDFAEHCTSLRDTVRSAVSAKNAGELSRAIDLIATLHCGPTSCPMPQGSHNGDCLAVTKSKLKALLLASTSTYSNPFEVSPPSANPERERLLANEMFARGIHIVAEARKERIAVPADFEKSWSEVCGGLACASRDGWKAFAVAVDRETGCIVPEDMFEHPYDILISRLKIAIISSEMVVRLVQGLQVDPKVVGYDNVRTQVGDRAAEKNEVVEKRIEVPVSEQLEARALGSGGISLKLGTLEYQCRNSGGELLRNAVQVPGGCFWFKIPRDVTAGRSGKTLKKSVQEALRKAPQEIRKCFKVTATGIEINKNCSYEPLP